MQRGSLYSSGLEKNISQNSEKFSSSFIKNYLVINCKNHINLSLFELVTLNFTMHILKMLTCSLKMM